MSAPQSLSLPTPSSIGGKSPMTGVSTASTIFFIVVSTPSPAGSGNTDGSANVPWMRIGDAHSQRAEVLRNRQ